MKAQTVKVKFPKTLLTGKDPQWCSMMELRFTAALKGVQWNFLVLLDGGERMKGRWTEGGR